jgi:BlaR1 peptidase M56
MRYIGAGTANVFGASFNLSDFLVAQYLQGSIQIDPFTFETMLGFQGAVLNRVIHPDSVLDHAVLAGFGLGVAVLSVRLLLSAWRLRQVLGRTHLWRRTGSVDLRLSDTITVPFSTRGLWRRHVVLPLEMLARQGDLGMAVAHEFQHLRQRDVEWEFGFEALRPMLFWNPAFHFWKRRIEELRELACDHRILARKGMDVAAYLQCLLRVCDDSLAPRRPWAVSMPVVGLLHGWPARRLTGQGQMFRRRLEAVVAAVPQPPVPKSLIMLLIPLPAVTLMAALSIQQSADWTQDRLMLSTILNLERFATINSTTPSLITP